MKQIHHGAIVMRFTLALIAASILLSGCASYWHHPYKGQADFDQDHTVCEYVILVARPAAGELHFEATQRVKRCLELGGWVGPYFEDQPGYNISVGPF